MCEKDSKSTADVKVSVALLLIAIKSRMADLTIRVATGKRERREASEALYLMGAMDVLSSIVENSVDGAEVIQAFEGRMNRFIDAIEEECDEFEEVGNVD